MGKKKQTFRKILVFGWVLIVLAKIGICGYAEQIRKDYNICTSCPYQHGSRYQCAYTIIKADSDEVLWSGWNAPEIWNLLWTDGDNSSGTLPAYMLNAEPVEINENGCAYRKEPLDGPKGEQIGAVLQKSFPYLSLQELEQAVNDCFGPGSVKNLTAGEAISAAQQAIWKIQYGERFVKQEHYVSIRGLGEYVPEQFVCPESLQQSIEQEDTRNNIVCLFQYYLTLDAERTAENPEIGFSRTDYDAAACGDGSWKVYTSIQFNGIGDIEEMNLTFSCGEILKTIDVNQPEISFSVSGLKQPEAVSLVLETVQKEMQPYRFVPEGEGPVLIACEEQKLYTFSQKQVGKLYTDTEDKSDTVFTVHTDGEFGRLHMRMVPQLMMIGGVMLIFAGAMVGLQCFRKHKNE